MKKLAALTILMNATAAVALYLAQKDFLNTMADNQYSWMNDTNEELHRWVQDTNKALSEAVRRG